LTCQHLDNLKGPAMVLGIMTVIPHTIGQNTRLSAIPCDNERHMNAPKFSLAKPNPKLLPKDLDPVTAGRWGLWLLGRWQHKQALRRTVVVRLYPRKSLAGKFVNLCFPWPVWSYPGPFRALAQLVGVTNRTAAAYIAGRRRMPLARRERLAAYLRADLAERLEVIRLLELPDERDEKVARDRRQGLAKAQAANREKRVMRVRGRPTG
jgi:transcriptional regulator with XRE-family HTH domain